MLSVIYAECHYAECHKKALYAECRYAECRGAINYAKKIYEISHFSSKDLLTIQLLTK